MIKSFVEQYLGPRPKKVNCWYCGQDSYLLPGSGMSPTCFYCNLCENKNTRDENGEIIDNIPSENERDENEPDNKGHCVKTELQISSKELCENCLADQRMNRMYLNQYIPDENDPSYQSRWESAREYERYLDEKTPLCKDCQIKVDRFNKAQEKRLPKKLDIKDRNEEARTPPGFHLLNIAQKSTLVYVSSQCLWYSAHIFAMIVNAYGYRYPPTSTTQSNGVPDVQSDIPVMASRGNNGGLDIVKLAMMNACSKLENRIACFISRGNNQETCAITSNYITFYYMLNIASVFVIYWHPLVSMEYEGGNPKAKHYDVYKACQVVLFLYRMSIPILLHYASSELLLGFFVIYISVLYFTTEHVQVQGHRILKRVGKNLAVESATPPPSATPTPSSSKVRSSRYINDELKEAMTYKPKDTVDYSDTTIERDDAVHRATYDLNKLKL